MPALKFIQNKYRGRVLDKVFQHTYDKSISRRVEDNQMPLGLLFQQFADSPEVPKRMMRMAKFFGLNKQQLAHPNIRGKLIIERCNNCRMRGICFKNREGKLRDRPGFDRERCANIETYRTIALQSGKRAAIHNHVVKHQKDFAGLSPKSNA